MIISSTPSIARLVNPIVPAPAKGGAMSVLMGTPNSRGAASSARKHPDLSTELAQDVVLGKKELSYPALTVRQWQTCIHSCFLAVAFCQRDALKLTKMVSAKYVGKDSTLLMKSFAINVIQAAKHVLMLTTVSHAQMATIGKWMMEDCALNVHRDAQPVLMTICVLHASISIIFTKIIV